MLACAVVVVLLGRAGVLNNFRASVGGKAVSLAVAAIALNVLMGYAGQISLAHMTFVGIGAYTAGYLTAVEHLRMPFYAGIVGAMLMGAGIAFLIGLPALRLRGLYLAIVTIGFTFVGEESLFRIEALSGGSGGIRLPRPYFGGAGLTRDSDYLALLVVILAVVWLIDSNLLDSKLGRAFHAIRADEQTAASFGIDTAGYKLLAFGISGAMAGLAGAMLGPVSGIANAEAFPFESSLALVIFVIVGGLGSRVGALVMALTFTIFPEILVKVFGGGIRGFDLIIGSLLLIATVAINPGGLAAALREREEKRNAKEYAEADTATLPDLPRPSGITRRIGARRGQPLLSVRDATVRFGGLIALDGASINVFPGTITGLIGPNGAGKTTLFNVAAGVIKPSRGHVELFGKDVTNEPAFARAELGLGRTFQLIGLAKHLSVLDNLMLAQHTVADYGIGEALLRVGRAPAQEKQLRERAMEAIRALGFERYRDTSVKHLSHGQQRIVEIGCTLVTAPELVLLDEPSAGMSPGAAENLAERLADIRDQLGRTVLIIEHNLPLVLGICDEIYTLSAGQVIAHDTPEEIAVHPEVVASYLGTAVV
ncbi:MAG: branched-chain amino acid transport system ATP-binding protein [Frankiaceae bacterium]|nr:branched-chain amino acid transport system ATP-binding protein [Frankiaceae bacterium]